MFTNLATRLTNYLRVLNKRRRCSSRLNRLKRHDAKIKNLASIPELCERVLLISTSEGWGDSLFVAGLASRIKANGIRNVAIAYPDRIAEHFSNPIFDHKWSLDSETSNIKQYQPDIIVDLTFTNVSYAEERLNLIKGLECPAITVYELSRNLNVYSHFISLNKKAHISERLALVLSLLTHNADEQPVYPYGYATAEDYKFANLTISSLFHGKLPSRIAYLNTLARHADRCLTEVQATSLAKTLILNGFEGIIINSNKQIVIDEDKVCYLPTIKFQQLTALIAQMDLVITPDTAVTHLASSFDIPSFIIFSPNDRDFWTEYAGKEAWGSLSTYHLNFSIDNTNLKIDQYGYANIRSRPSSSYNPSELAQALSNFIKSLHL